MPGVSTLQAQCSKINVMRSYGASVPSWKGPSLLALNLAMADNTVFLPNVVYLKLNSSARRGKFRKSVSWVSKAESGSESAVATGEDERKKVVVVGAGWAGLGAAHHLTKQVSRSLILLSSITLHSYYSERSYLARCRGVAVWMHFSHFVLKNVG